MAAPLADDQRIAIGFGTHDPAGTDGAAGPGDVLDQNGLTERCLHAFGERARDKVGRATCWERCDNGDRSRRIGLRPCDARGGRQRGTARYQIQKITAGKFHFEPPFTSFDHLVGAAGYGLYVFAPAGRRTVKTEPLPGSLFTFTSPPIMRASLRVMASPSPVPPNFCAVAASAWLNSSNNFACCSAVMPIPVSETANSTKLLPLLTLRAASLTSPALVNLHALLNKLSRICPSRRGSTVNAPRFSWASTTRRFLFCSASCPAVP